MSNKNIFDYDLIVIGSGAGGSAAATIAASEGKKVAIIESDSIGGDSPNWTDVPIKAMLHVANLFDETKSSAKFGLRLNTLGFNYPSIRAWKDLVVKHTGQGSSKQFYEGQGIHVYSGLAHFISPNEISVNRRHLSASYFLIATGSDWRLPRIPGLEQVGFLTPRTVLDILRSPKSILVVGGGTVGVEISQLLSSFGTKVHIVEKEDRLLPHLDPEVGQTIQKVLLDSKEVTTHTQSSVVGVEKDGILKRVVVSRAGSEKIIKVEQILIACGRMPKVDLGLENAGIIYGESGILVNEFLQTNLKHIYASGKVLGRKRQTHTSIMESQIVANNILRRNKLSPDYSADPEIIFTNPGVATVGMTEKDCENHKIAINKAVAPLSIIARSNASDFRDGFVKIIADKKGVIIGASVVAPHASEIIHELVLAIKHKLTVTDVAATPHAFLSWSEAVRVAAAKLA